MLDILRREIVTSMRLLGAASISDLNPDMVINCGCQLRLADDVFVFAGGTSRLGASGQAIQTLSQKSDKDLCTPINEEMKGCNLSGMIIGVSFMAPIKNYLYKCYNMTM